MITIPRIKRAPLRAAFPAFPDRRVILFLDLNETLIRTGEVGLRDRLTEQRQHETFCELCVALAARRPPLDVVLLTGNSFEYSRRIEEPLGLKNRAGIDVTIVSENGLLARAFRRGDLWRETPAPAYAEATMRFLDAMKRDQKLGAAFYSQGNEVRLTLKPVANRFLDEELTVATAIAERSDPRGAVQFYFHPFYIDADPKEIIVDGHARPFGGKAYAVERLLAEEDRFPIAIGDSLSDAPAFASVAAHGGCSFLIGNADHPRLAGAIRVGAPFAAGVNAVLRALLDAP